MGRERMTSISLVSKALRIWKQAKTISPIIKIIREAPAAKVIVISRSSKKAVLPSVADITVANNMLLSKPINNQSLSAVIRI